MVVASLIERKRGGEALTASEWRELLLAYGADAVPDYQMAALLMAVFFQGLTAEELYTVTETMLHSSAGLSFDGWETPRVGKHSTGGVGDKTSIVLVPLLACCDVAVPMLSGRGLGHTGGTLDKLESIPGFRTGLSIEEAERQVRTLGCAMLGQSRDIAPIDRKLYALRDVTATIESIPLIAASIMSKKLAEGLNGLVLDVKTGSGAFMVDVEDALALAQTMIELGEAHGCRTTALLTAMDRPLGRAVGNALEIEECILTLQGEGPSDLVEVILALGSEMLLSAGVAGDRAEARGRLEDALASGKALERFAALIEAQGGNPAIIDDPAVLPQAEEIEVLEASAAGVVQSVEPRRIGLAVIELGGGRQRLDEDIDPSVGFVVSVKPGDRVAAGEAIASVFARDAEGIRAGRAALEEAIVIGEVGSLTPLISHRVTAAGTEVLEVT
ncbi:MAG: thymidine phosphorylase [Gemmatimonadetes bacterium]|nr:MAG: thymidine phosphorylase [Gemmatimonadota bacterium]